MSHPGKPVSRRPNRPNARHDAIHRALLTGLLSNIGQRGIQHEYTGTRGTKFSIFPGSALFKANPPWLMAAELVETTKLYARTVAPIRVEWIERAAAHLVKRTYSEPHWHGPSAHVVAFEKVMLRGLVIVPRRTVHYGPVDPRTSWEMFIHHALVEGDFRTSAGSILDNWGLMDFVFGLQAKARRDDLFTEPAKRFAFYNARIPADVFDGPRFEQWRREAEKENPDLLRMQLSDVMKPKGEAITPQLYPDYLQIGPAKVELEYRFEPGHVDDGITARIPLAALNQMAPEPFEWLVPGQLLEKIDWVIRSLPKALRVLFVPVPEFAKRAYEALASGSTERLSPSPGTPGDGGAGGVSAFSVQNSVVNSNPHPTSPPEYKGREQNLFPPMVSLRRALADYLGRIAGVSIQMRDFSIEEMPAHLRMNFRVIDSQGNSVSAGRDLVAIRQFLGLRAKQAFATLPSSEWNRDNLSRWDFEDIPPSVEIRYGGLTLSGYPALVDKGKSVSLRLFDAPEAAAISMRTGIVRLFMVQLHKEVTYLERSIPHIEQLCLYYALLGSCDALREEISRASADRALFGDGPYVRTRAEFIERADAGWRHLSAAFTEINAIVRPALELFHELSLELSQPAPPLLLESIEDMRSHLRRLMPADFLTATPFAWLVHLPRFLEGIKLRLKKLRSAGAIRDLQQLGDVRDFEKRYAERLASLQSKGIVDPRMEQFRWMLEEFRVSSFAQELRTAVPVSVKRLEAIWDAMRD